MLQNMSDVFVARFTLALEFFYWIGRQSVTGLPLVFVCNHVTRRPCWFSFSKNLHKNGFYFPEREMLCPWPPTWCPWRHLQTSNKTYNLSVFGYFKVARETGSVLFRIPPWNCLRTLSLLSLANHKFVQGTGSKFVPQNSPIVQFHATHTQSAAQP